jgi:DNA-binding GntR family transcriptional regulator
MNLQEILKAVNDNTLAVAKALQSGNNEEAVDLLTKHAEVINSRIEKSSDPEKTEEKEKEVPDNIPK